MIRALATGSFAVAMFVVACSSSNGGTPGGGGASGAISCSNSDGAPVNGLESESSSFGCDKPLALNGDAGAGADCQSAGDCAPTCCACPAGKQFDEALVVACVNGHCVDAQTACCGLLASTKDETSGAHGPCD